MRTVRGNLKSGEDLAIDLLEDLGTRQTIALDRGPLREHFGDPSLGPIVSSVFTLCSCVCLVLLDWNPGGQSLPASGSV